jgi:hypothetical protein
VIYQTGLQAQISNIISLISSAESATETVHSAANLSRGYAAFIKEAQKRTPHAEPLRPNIICAYEEAMQFCTHLQKDALSLLDDKAQNEVVTIKKDVDAERKGDLIRRAVQCIAAISPCHKALFDLIITDVFIMPSDCARGGSTSAALGVIWANPKLSYRVPDVVEFLVHEIVHHAMFVDELCYGHYDYDLILPEERWANSAILHVERPIDKVLHSLVVAAEILAFRNDVSGHLSDPKVHPPTPVLVRQTKASIASLFQVLDRELQLGHDLLRPRARDLLGYVEKIVDSIPADKV